MIKIFICEDDAVQRSRIRDFVEKSVIIENIDMEIHMDTGSPYEIIDEIENMNETGLYFIDIDLGVDINGIELAGEIRKYDPRGYIVFITTHSEMCTLTFEYKIEALDFIIKDDYSNMNKRIRECIISASERYSSKNSFKDDRFSFRIKDKSISLKYSEILFFETSFKSRKIVIHCDRKQFEFTGSLKEIGGQLGESFIATHKSYIVNRDRIKSVDFKNRLITMDNDEECILSVRKAKYLR